MYRAACCANVKTWGHVGSGSSIISNGEKDGHPPFRFGGDFAAMLPSDVLIAIVDGLKGFPEAITAVFPQTQVQTCIVHLIRNSLDFVSYKDSGDVGRQPGKTQKGIEVGGRHALLASDMMHGQLGVLDQARLDVVGARKDPEQARIGGRLVIGILDQHAHFATDALQAYRHRQPQEVIGCVCRCLMLHRQINRSGQQLAQPTARERDVDAIGSDVHAADRAMNIALTVSGAPARRRAQRA